MKIQQKYSHLILGLVFAILFAGNIFAGSDPVRFNGWQTLGPNGGDIRVIAVDPKNKNKIYLTTLDSQIYSSSDAGKTWRHLTSFSRPQVMLDDLIVDREDSNIIYVSGHRHLEPGGFMYSKDAGQTWKEAKDLKNEAIHALAQSPSNPNILLAGGNGKVFISYNKGEDWTRITDDKVAFLPQIVDSAAFDPRNANTIYIGTTWRAYKSTDGGKSWRLISKGMIDDSDVFAIDIDPSNPDHIVSSACSGIYESFNGGELWVKIQGIPSQSRRTKAIVRNPAKNGGIYAGTTEGFWMSANDGKSWALTSQRELEVNSIAVHPDEPNKIYIATNNYGIMVSNDGGHNFSIQNGNFSSRFTHQIIPDSERPNRFYALTNNTSTGGGFIFISDDGGQTWTTSNRNLSVIRIKTFSLLQAKENSNTILIGTNNGIFRSLDRGSSWAALPVGKIPPPKVTKKTVVVKGKKRVVTTKEPANPNLVASLKDRVSALAYTNDGKDGLIAATDNGLFRTYNIANGWEKLPFGEEIDEQIFAMNVSPAQPETIWAGTVRSGVLVSKDNGVTWKRITDIPSVVPIKAIETDPQNPNRIYVGTEQTFYLSRDSGDTFIRRMGGLPMGSYNTILINPQNPNEVYTASAMDTHNGLFHSTDAGQTWKKIDGKDKNLPSRRVWTMVFDPQNSNRILLGTHSSGIFRIEKDSTDAKVIDQKAAEPKSDNMTRPRVASNGN